LLGLGHFFAGSGLGRVEAFLAQVLDHIWATFFLEILLGLGWAGNFLGQALGHIWAIYLGYFSTRALGHIGAIFSTRALDHIGRFFEQGARSHWNDFQKHSPSD
jgi:hypothetical protein